MWLIIGVVLAGVAPEALGQVVDSGGMQDQSVGDLVDKLRKWELAILGVSFLLVIALLFAGGLLRPGGFAKAGLRDISTLPSVIWLFAIMMVFLAMFAAPETIKHISWIHEQEFDETQMLAINTVGMYLFGIIAGLGMLFVLKRSTIVEGESKSGLGLSFLDLPVGLGCFMLAFPFIQLMNLLGVFAYSQTQGESPNGMGHGTLQMLVDQPENGWVWAIVASAVIGAPFVEELIYRVFLQGALIKWLKSPWLAIIFGSIIFAGMHRIGGTVPWHALLPIFAVGMSCGIAYERTKRVGVPIMMHMCFNLYNVVLALIINANASQTGVL
ncbi:MAG: CPBP family intramembrane metalloprotease [Phycisphaerales bacterium]|nr:CPBP family intramembrane metalloprotease [Phycisphaerales bacterium]